MIAAAKAILKANDRGGYTVPTPHLYPFQWNWDSAFVAMGFATYDLERALQELESLVKGQWEGGENDGFIPHIIFHQEAESYFPGPKVWGLNNGKVNISGITQPPVFGIALSFIAKRAKGQYKERILNLLHAVHRNHAWWIRARDLEGRGVVSLLHAWESGSDNSPLFDEASKAIPTTTSTLIQRKDIGHVDAAMRPTNEDYSRFIHLVDLYKDCGWNPQKMCEATPFKIAEPQINSILALANEECAFLAQDLAEYALAEEFLSKAHYLKQGIKAHFFQDGSVALNMKNHTTIKVETQASFMPILALKLNAAEKINLQEKLNAFHEGCIVGIPSTNPSSPLFEPKRYWRGPVWAIINWLIIIGLKRQNLTLEAENLRLITLRAIETGGFAEYFNPISGEALGGQDFSWTAAAYLVLKEDA